mmetsp:Transcript_28206/g.61286  ORF Transcript_28206/g.61286 Transcript_28206/m.61286 type:complete len:1033 (+) Transcript_28206:163-3261(+)
MAESMLVDEQHAEGDEALSRAAMGFSERVLEALKPWARMAYKDAHAPLPDTGNDAQARWEAYSTWTLLLCLYHAEAEAERCHISGWKAEEWLTESQALRHLYLEHRSLRWILGILRWLRWIDTWDSDPEDNETEQENPQGDEGESGLDASFQKSALKLKQHLDTGILEESGSFHPDGPLQCPDQFLQDDLEQEKKLLRRVMRHLRRGKLDAALRCCEHAGQPWRVAMISGMFAYADASESDAAQAGYKAVRDDEEQAMAALKAEHTDWTELGSLDSHSGCRGNPWRRIWKEQCHDSATRQLKRHMNGNSSGTVSAAELAMLGFCSGHLDALRAGGGSSSSSSRSKESGGCIFSYADRVWTELHCLKEWLVEALLDLEREHFCAADVFLGEGDFGIPDPTESDESRRSRRRKLHGKLDGLKEHEIEAFISREVERIVTPSKEEEHYCCEAPPSSPASPSSSSSSTPPPSFCRLQAALIAGAWQAERGSEALKVVNSWVTGGLAHSDQKPPFVVAEFASRFAIWQSEVLLDVHSKGFDHGPGAVEIAEAAAEAAAKSAVEEHLRGSSGSSPLEPSLRGSINEDVDRIVGEHVRQMVASGEGQWCKQILDDSLEGYILCHLQPLSAQCRCNSFAALLLRLAMRTEQDPLRYKIQAMRKCWWSFWENYPADIPMLVIMLTQRVLRNGGPAEGEQQELNLMNVGLCGVNETACRAELSLGVLALIAFWEVARDALIHGNLARETIKGLEAVLQTPDMQDPHLGEAATNLWSIVVTKAILENVQRLLEVLQRETYLDDATNFETARKMLNILVLPCVCEMLAAVSTKDPERGAQLAAVVKGSLLGEDAEVLISPVAQLLKDLIWFAELVNAQCAWSEAKEFDKASRPIAAGFGTGAQLLADLQETTQRVDVTATAYQTQERSKKRSELLSVAVRRLKQDKSFLSREDDHLELVPHTIPASKWERMRSALCCRVMLMMLSVFEAESDFEGAMQQLLRDISGSPWMLQVLEPHHVRALLGRLSVVPTRLEHEQLCTPIGG